MASGGKRYVAKRGPYKVKHVTPEEVEAKRLAHNERQKKYYHANVKACQARVTDWKNRNIEHVRMQQRGYMENYLINLALEESRSKRKKVG